MALPIDFDMTLRQFYFKPNSLLTGWLNIGWEVNPVSYDELSLTFSALADPTRRAILARLATDEATVNQLAEPFSISVQAISKHLKVLEGAGLITRGREGQFRPCRLEVAPLEAARQWIVEHRQVWRERFDRLDEQLKRLQSSDVSTSNRTSTTKEKGTQP